MLGNISFGKNILHHILLLILLLCVEGSAVAWDKMPLTQTLNIYSGLSDDTVNDVLCDTKGFIWFATHKGLDRYDGKHIKYISVNGPRTICEDLNGDIWLGTSDGVYKYEVMTDVLHQIDLPSAVHGIQPYSVYHSDGVILVQCGAEFCVKINQKTGDIDRLIPSVCIYPEDDVIYAISAAGELLASSDGMVTNTVLIDGYSRDFLEVRRLWRAGNYLALATDANECYFVNLDSKEVLPIGRKLYDVLERKNGEIWLSYSDGISIVDEELKEVGAYHSDRRGAFWIPESVRTLAEDYQGGVWAGTYYSGVFHMEDNLADVATFEPNVADPLFWPRNIIEDPEEGLWVASSSSGLYRFYPQKGKLEKVWLPQETGLNEYIAAASIVGDDLLVGNRNGTYLINRKTCALRNLTDRNEESRAFMYDNGELWVSFAKGLYRRDNNGVFVEVSKDSYSSIMKDAQGNVWATSFFYGILKYSPNGIVQCYNLSNGNSCSQKISSIVQGKDGRIWAGTYGDGLLSYNVDEDEFEKDGDLGELTLPIFKIVIDDDGKFWITTSQSIILFDPISRKSVSYTQADGLPISSFNYSAGLLASDGKMYVGARDRILSFSPQLKNLKPSEIRLAVTNFRLLGETMMKKGYSNIEVLDKLVLPNGANSFEFEVSDMNYSLPRNSYLYYRLDGLSKKWIPITDSKITFVNLPVGNYTLRIKPMDAAGNFYNLEKTVDFRVKPPFMLSFFMIVVYVVVLWLSILIIMRRYRRRALRDARAKAMTESLIRESEAEKKLYASKIEFLTNIAHEIKTPLSLIKLPIESLSRRFRSFSDKTVLEDVEIIHKNSEKLNRLVEEFLSIREIDSVNYDLNLEECNVSKMVPSIFRRFEDAFRKEGIKPSLELGGEQLITSLDRVHFDKILSNMFSNALKYSDSIVRVSCSCSDKNFTIIVENDGDIVPLDMREKIFQPLFRYVKPGIKVPGVGLGLSISRKLTSLMGGAICMDEDLSVNRFILTLPLVDISRQNEQGAKNKEKEIEFISERKTVMVVENNDDMAAYITRKLDPYYSVVRVEDGRKALDYLDSGKMPSVVITDLVMPNLDGFTLCKDLKRNKRTSNIPIIVLSSIPEKEAKIQTLECGADAYLEKPFSFDLLYSTLNSMILNKERVQNYYSAYPIVGGENSSLSVLDSRFLRTIQECIMANLANASLRVEDLAKASNMSKSNLLKKMKALVAMTPAEYILKIRLKKSQELLLRSEYSVSEISSLVGFSSPSYFSQAFTREFGVYPKSYREKFKSE